MQNLSNDKVQYLQFVTNNDQQTLALGWDTQVKRPNIEEALASFADVCSRTFPIKFQING